MAPSISTTSMHRNIIASTRFDMVLNVEEEEITITITGEALGHPSDESRILVRVVVPVDSKMYLLSLSCLSTYGSDEGIPGISHRVTRRSSLIRMCLQDLTSFWWMKYVSLLLEYAGSPALTGRRIKNPSASTVKCIISERVRC